MKKGEVAPVSANNINNKAQFCICALVNEEYNWVCAGGPRALRRTVLKITILIIMSVLCMRYKEYSLENDHLKCFGIKWYYRKLVLHISLVFSVDRTCHDSRVGY
ncbi:hypothetical protein PHYBLDRAFT_64267 [Phycomyces blakesleeanus NRRL 1555(-)]|uniref:Uncharacterized protein n=1 Tax=Phycomyces blakesleeanus (strain ATCC 8743b / DSM 1359 / FGSC 10004 / NBRC 33097 / NRRL 1555) TaxID=763407 RepID=A0A162UD15_PHYB8|nr:hypothetical protein PHYBLDRAFT_64267 [Phycomyces blakesleeanus NRRL 1555(-)]OAD75342.1 hypothetical protein PHYBLDRAFT_64267 [Phycomyces blakesleeanus NRRL 1555(-)]|eukprot:XP_018293382.1 hypothetical protein PHYBLDRAFT_64267 [Phycomyces blakesleeanus NRRL 1555(-)]